MLLLPNQKAAIERCLPACLMLTALGAAKDVECRPDVLEKLNVASVSPLSQFDTGSVAYMARKVSEDATTLLNSVSHTSPVDTVMATVRFTLMLVDRGLLQDPQNMAVLVSLMLDEEMKGESPGDPAFPIRDKVWTRGGENLLLRATLMGLYQKPVLAA